MKYLANKVVCLRGQKKELTPYGIQYIKKCQQYHISLEKIARKLDNISYNTLCFRCRDVGLTKQKKVRPPRTQVNHNYFSNIATPEQAYWLGFLCADGYVDESRGKITVSLQDNDKDFLEKFCISLGTDKKPKTYLNTCGSKKIPCCCLTIFSKQIVSDLVKLGCHQRKSKNLDSPADIIPSYLYKYWILGYLDGDGCISYSFDTRRGGLSVLGTYNVLSFMKENFNSDNEIRKEKRCTDIYIFSIQGHKAINVLDNLYDDYVVKNELYLYRKYKKYLEYKQLLSS